LFRAILALEDGTILSGNGFGNPCEISGEVVFNTGMVGYTESLTDPSYWGQILIQTYPLIGNYAVPSYSIAGKLGIPLHFESNSIKVAGYIVSSLTKNPSHWSFDKKLDDWLVENKIPGIEGVDTRELTKKLRLKGTMLGILKVAEHIDSGEIDAIKQKIKNIIDPNERDLVKEVTIPGPISYTDDEKFKNVVVIDCGVKFGIIRSLLARNVNVVRVPADYPVEKIMEFAPNGILISNGPGDPKKCVAAINTVKKFLEDENSLPIMGICLGNQILALAAGADTYKLKFGHRGQNHPCIDLFSKRCYITSQNHGYAIEEGSLDATNFETFFVNANDKTIEGIKHKSKPVFGVQFHPEASPGPYETGYLFENFVGEVKKCQN
jgi:carbamoyl-phosphate synthase small subunit